MSVIISFNHHHILKVKNSTFEILYNFLLEHTENNNIILNENLKKFIEDLYLGAYGYCFDFAKYLKNGQDGKLFLSWLRIAIEKMNDVFIEPYRQERMQLLWNFYHELEKYIKELPNE